MRELRAGYAEVVKYGLIRDADGFFDWLERHGAAVLAGDPTARAEAIRRSLEIKAAIVAADERETSGERALLNFGHTFAHAYEALAGYDGGLLHGEAVAVGMVKALALSVRLGHCPPEDLTRARAHLAASGAADQAGGGQQPAVPARRAAGRHGPRQEGRGRAAPVRSGAPHRRRLHQRRRAERSGARGTGRGWLSTLATAGWGGSGRCTSPSLAVVLLLAANAFFVAAEFALVKVRAIRLEALAAAGSGRARLATQHPQASRGLSRRLPARHHHGVAGPGLGRRAGGRGPARAPVPCSLGLSEAVLHTVAFLTGFLIFSSLHIVIGEQVPKTLAIRQPEPICSGSRCRCTPSSCCAGRSTGR